MNVLEDFSNRIYQYLNEKVNPVSYTDWLQENTKLAGLPFSVSKYPFQRKILDDMHTNLCCIKPSQIGLALALDTPILTSKGWSTMGELEVGDHIYSASGELTEVTYLSPIYTDHKCFELTFCDHTKIVADAGHRWYVECDKAFNSEGLLTKTGRLPPNTDYVRNGVVNTEFLSRNYKRLDRNLFGIPTISHLKHAEANLVVDPYFLGLWLGDGSNASCNLTATIEDANFYKTELEKRGMTARITIDRGSVMTVKVDVVNAVRYDSMYSRLTELGVIGKKEKSIPREYLTAGKEQRLELMRGLLDTDGSIGKNGRIEFYNTSTQLIDDFMELACSLGYKPRVRWRDPKETTMKSGHVIKSKKPLGVVGFLGYSDQLLFKLPRKATRMIPKEGARYTESFTRRITEVVEVTPVPVRCLTVAHPSHLFLCGKSLIATHNTEVQVRKALAIAARNPHRTVLFTLPNEDMRKRLYQTRVEQLVKNTPAFNPMGQKPARSIEITQILDSYMLMLPVTEAAATSQPADVVFNDEVDLSDQPLLALFNSRMQGSDWRMSQRFSTPTYDGFGISADFDLSDQHHYMYRCPRCNHHQIPEFNRKFVTVPKLPDNLSEDYSQFDLEWIDDYKLDINTAYLHCEKCREPMNLKDSSLREWVAKYPNRTHHRGYRVSPFSVDTLPPSYIFNQLFTYRRNDNMKGWYNTVLGLPYEGGDERLSRKDILNCFTEMIHPVDYEDGWQYFIGADMGNLCHITVGRSRDGVNLDILLMETVNSNNYEERMMALKDRYDISMGFSDRFPLTETVNRVCKRSENILMPLQYQHGKGAERFKYHDDELGDLSHCSVARTWHLDQLVNMVRNTKITFSGYGSQKELIIEHLRDMVRESKDEEVPVWKKLNGKDHYFHSLGYCNQAMIQFFDGKNASSNGNSTLYFGGIDVKFPASSISGLFGNNNFKRGSNNGGNLF